MFSGHFKGLFQGLFYGVFKAFQGCFWKAFVFGCFSGCCFRGGRYHPLFFVVSMVSMSFWDGDFEALFCEFFGKVPLVCLSVEVFSVLYDPVH